jgi:peptidoglycan-associated lipoprotein
MENRPLIPTRTPRLFSTRSAALLLAPLLAVLAACSSTPIAPAATAPTTSATSAATAPAAPAATAATSRPTSSATVSTASLPPYLDPKNPLSTERSVYFDFDEFSIKPDYTALIERHGRYLAANPRVAIKIEGHTDERGGTEYNLALGQKRAEAVLRALRIYGARDAQMEAISWGETKPKALGHDEAAWALNRRADLQYPKQ